jgi:hypothetical protein
VATDEVSALGLEVVGKDPAPLEVAVFGAAATAVVLVTVSGVVCCTGEVVVGLVKGGEVVGVVGVVVGVGEVVGVVLGEVVGVVLGVVDGSAVEGSQLVM